MDYYKNLMRLSSKRKITNNPIDFDYLSSNAMGLLAVIPPHENEIYHFIKENNIKEATNHLNLLKLVFNNIFLGVTLNTKEDRELFKNVKFFSLQKEIEMVEASPISFLNVNDSDVYQTLLSIANGGGLVKLTNQNESEYLHSYEELEIFYKDNLYILENTLKIYNKCNVELGFNGYQLPKYDNNVDANLYLK